MQILIIEKYCKICCKNLKIRIEFAVVELAEYNSNGNLRPPKHAESLFQASFAILHRTPFHFCGCRLVP